MHNLNLTPGWGECLDIKVLGLLAQATETTRRSRKVLHTMASIVYLEERLHYGDGVVRVAATSLRRTSAPQLEAAGRTICTEARQTHTEALERLRSPRGRRASRGVYEDGTQILFELERSSGATRHSYLGLRDARTTLALETYTIATRPGTCLVAGPERALRAVEAETSRITTGISEPRPAYQIQVHATRTSPAVLETLTTLYEETETPAGELLETAELLVQ